jgi:hypothetical protein
MIGNAGEARYAFYDKRKDKNDGWLWFHRELSLDNIIRFYRDYFVEYFRNALPEGRGFVRFEGSLVLYQYRSDGKDEKGRDHWVLLLAWIPESHRTSDAWGVLDNEIFRHVSSGKDTLPDQLSVFDYESEIVKLAYEGSTVDGIASDDGRSYVEQIESRGAVNIVFYRVAHDKVTIKTQKKGNLQGPAGGNAPAKT